jgi:hypothetical protein
MTFWKVKTMETVKYSVKKREVVREDNGVNKKVQKHFGAVRLFCMIIK